MSRESTQRPDTENSNSKPTSHQPFTFEWDNMLRIIGSITGIASITALFDWIFGYGRYLGFLASTNISLDLQLSIPKEQYFLAGSVYFLKFIIDIGLCLLIYYVAQSTKSIVKHISHPFATLIFGIILFLGFTIGGILVINTNTTLLFLYTGIVILLITVELVFTKTNNQQFQNNYFNALKSLYLVIKTLILGYLIFFFFAFHFTNALKSGSAYGCQLITGNPTSAILYSNNLIALDGVSKVDEAYIYNGYYLSFSDDNNYYLFREVDPDTLKPKSILIIPKDALKAIKLEKVITPKDWNLKKTCSDLYKD